MFNRALPSPMSRFAQGEGCEEENLPRVSLGREMALETRDLFAQEMGAMVVSSLAVQGFSRGMSSVFGLTAVGLVFEKIPLIAQAVYRARRRGTKVESEVGSVLHADLWHDLAYSALTPLLLSALNSSPLQFLQGGEWLANSVSFALAVPVAVVMRRAVARTLGLS